MSYRYAPGEEQMVSVIAQVASWSSINPTYSRALAGAIAATGKRPGELSFDEFLSIADGLPTDLLSAFAPALEGVAA